MLSVISSFKSGIFYSREFFRDIPFSDFLSKRLAGILSDEINEKISYCSVSRLLLNELMDQKRENEEQILGMRRQIEENEKEARKREEQINKLAQNDSVQVLQKKLNDLAKELVLAKDSNFKVQETIEDQASLLQSQKSELAFLQANIEKKKLRISKEIAESKELEQKIEKGARDLLKSNSKVEELSKRLLAFRDIFDKNLVQLNVVKNLVSKLKQDNDDLRLEVDCLQKKLTAGYENLTPRPNFQSIIEKNGLEAKCLFPFQESLKNNGLNRKSCKVSTCEAVNQILGKLRKMENENCASTGQSPHSGLKIAKNKLLSLARTKKQSERTLVRKNSIKFADLAASNSQEESGGSQKRQRTVKTTKETPESLGEASPSLKKVTWSNFEEEEKQNEMDENDPGASLKITDEVLGEIIQTKKELSDFIKRSQIE